MKKSLSLLLAIALVVSMFGSLAYAADADLTAQQKFEALKAKGIFAGINGEAALDKNMNRAQFARVAALILGLEGIGDPDTKQVTEKPFKDVDLNKWYTEEVAAVKEAGLMVGNGDGTFNPTGDITVQQLAVVVAGLLKLQPVEGATVEGAANWAAGYIKAIQNAGITYPTNYTEPAKRELLVNLAFVADAKINPGTASSITAAVTSAKKITVTFNAPVDTAKAKITVWNGTNQVNSKSITFAEDKKSAVVEFAFNLAAADYTVKVEGITETALTATVKVEAEKVAKIEFTSDKAALDRSDSTIVRVGYRVLNQYGEEINSTALSATAGKGSATAASGTLTLDAATDFVLGEKVVVSLVHTSGAFATATVEVSAVAQVASVDIVKLHNNTNKDRELVAGSTDDFRLVLDLKDQYGASVTSTTYLPTDLIITVSNPTAASLVGYSSSTNTATFNNTLNLDGKNWVNLQLAGGLTAGTSTVTIISKSTGAKDSFDLVVKENVKIDTLTLSAPAVAPAGSTVNIPYTAIDQFGKTIEHPTDSMRNSASASGTTPPTFVKDVVKNVTNLQLTLPSSKGTVIVTIVTGTNKVAQLSIEVVDARTPTVISGIKDLDTALHKDGGSAVLGTGNVVVKDQYGSDITPTWGAGNYRVKVETSDSSKVTLNGGSAAVYADGTTTATLGAAAKGSSAITLTLEKWDSASSSWKTVDNSSYTFNSKVVEKGDIKSYTATVAGTVYTTATNTYFKDLTVKGTLEDGSTVTVPYNAGANYEVNITTANIQYAGGKISATGYTLPTDKDEVDATILVIVKGATTETIPVTFKVADAAPAATKLSLKDGFDLDGAGTAYSNVAKEGDGVVSARIADVNTMAEVYQIVRGIVKVEDQYGVELTNDSTLTPNTGIIVSNVTDGHVIHPTVDTLSTIAVGDTFTVTVITNNGKYISFKVVVKA